MTTKQILGYFIGFAVAVSGFLAAFTFNKFADKLDKVYDISLRSESDIEYLKEKADKHDKKIDAHDDFIKNLMNMQNYYRKSMSSTKIKPPNLN